MKVVFLAGASELGGAERSLLDLIAGLRHAYPSWGLTVVLPGDGPLRAALDTLAVETTIVAQPPEVARLGDAAVKRSDARRLPRLLTTSVAYARAVIPTLRYLIRLRAELARQSADVVHTNGFKLHFLGARAAPRSAAVVWHIRDFVSSRSVMRRLLATSAARCSVAIANSDAVAEDVRGVLPTLRVERVYNGIDLHEFRPEGPSLDIDAAVGWNAQPATVVRVGLVATFARWKGHEVFIRALASLPQALPIRGYIVGGPLYTTDGSQYSLDELRALASQHGVSPERLGFTGHVLEPAKAIRALDIVVHASTNPEPFGRVIAEAMAARRAVLVAQSGGAAELVGTLPGAAYTPGDWKSLARRIQELAGDHSGRARLADAGCTLARERFDRRRLPGQIAPIYERALEVRR